MEDREIVDLYWQRSERAVEETAAKYGKYCYAIAYNVLADARDAEESVNDAYLGAWNSMPDNRPSNLSAFLGKIVRRVAIDRWRAKYAAKRGGGEITLALDELNECVPTGWSPETAVEMEQLSAGINQFVMGLPLTEMGVFICRYWYMDSIENICRRFGFSQSKVKSMLARTRKRLLAYLEKEDLYERK